jgi:hypothetical protein
MTSVTRGAGADTVDALDEEDTERAVIPPGFEEGVPVPLPARARGNDSERYRRPTLQSPISELLAASMTSVVEPVGVAAAVPMAIRHTEVTARVVEAQRATATAEPSSEYSIEVVEDAVTLSRDLVAGLIDRARACMAVGDLPGAVMAADDALAAAQTAPPPGVNDVMAPARAMFDRIFAAYVGLLGKVPVLGKTGDDAAREPLDDLARAMIGFVDGVRTLEQLFVAAKVPPVAAVRTAASLLRAGIIRIA